MIVVSNATPIITLACVNQVDILKHFFDKVYIPQAVYDDKKAKKFAQSFGLKVIGSLGILLKAKEAELIGEIAPFIELLRDSRIFIDDKTYDLVLGMAGESK